MVGHRQIVVDRFGHPDDEEFLTGGARRLRDLMRRGHGSVPAGREDGADRMGTADGDHALDVRAGDGSARCSERGGARPATAARVVILCQQIDKVAAEHALDAEPGAVEPCNLRAPTCLLDDPGEAGVDDGGGTAAMRDECGHEAAAPSGSWLMVHGSGFWFRVLPGA